MFLQIYCWWHVQYLHVYFYISLYIYIYISRLLWRDHIFYIKRFFLVHDVTDMIWSFWPLSTYDNSVADNVAHQDGYHLLYINHEYNTDRVIVTQDHFVDIWYYWIVNSEYTQKQSIYVCEQLYVWEIISFLITLSTYDDPVTDNVSRRLPFRLIMNTVPTGRQGDRNSRSHCWYLILSRS